MTILVFVQMRQTVMVWADLLNEAARLSDRSRVARGLDFVVATTQWASDRDHSLGTVGGAGDSRLD